MMTPYQAIHFKIGDIIGFQDFKKISQYSGYKIIDKGSNDQSVFKIENNEVIVYDYESYMDSFQIGGCFNYTLECQIPGGFRLRPLPFI